MFDPERDAALMNRVKNGDRVAFEELYALYAKPIATFLHHLSWDGETVADGVQEVFLRLWRGARNWRPTGKFSTYLFQIAKNWWLNERAKRSRRVRTIRMDLPEDGEEGSPPSSEDPAAGPAALAAQRELGDRIRKAVSALPEKLQVTFVLSEYQHLSYAEIADVLSIPVGTVKSRMSAAEKTLRRKLEKDL